MTKLFKSPVVSCLICKQVYSAKGLSTHIVVSHTEGGKERWSRISDTEIAKVRHRGTIARMSNEQVYLQNVKQCKQCNTPLSYEKRTNKFCSRSCSATHSNTNAPLSRKRGPAKTATLSAHEQRKLKNNIVGPYSTVYHSKCAECSLTILSQYSKKYCRMHEYQYSHKMRAKYWFTFILKDYPDLFDFSLLKKYGMRSNDNIEGVVRDHKVSVADAIKYNYDPYYIKHPLNCELMINSKNAKKHKQSSMSYDELVTQVKEYNKKQLTLKENLSII